jgi:hypothetical protein
MLSVIKVYFKEKSMIAFLVDENESVENVYKQPNNVCETYAVDRSIVSHWTE